MTGPSPDSGREEPPRCPVHGVAKEQVYTHDIPAGILHALPEVVGVTRECDVCGDDTQTPDLVIVGDGRVCPECHGVLFVDRSTDTSETESTDDHSPALEAFADAVELFHEQRE